MFRREKRNSQSHGYMNVLLTMDTEIKIDYKPLVLILTWTEVH